MSPQEERQRQREQRRRQREQRLRERELRKRAFHLFGQLPTELRLEIWAHTWHPRTVSIGLIDYDETPPPREKNPLPASGYVNFESRSETLRYYKRSFARPGTSDFRWFNFRLDTLWVTDPLGPEGMFEFVDFGQVERLSIPQPHDSVAEATTPCPSSWPKPVTESFESPIIKELLAAKYPSLKEVTLRTSRWYISSGGCSDYRPRVLRLGAWGHLRTTYIGGLKVQHSTEGPESYEQLYCCRLSEVDVELLVESIFYMLGD
ncbi:hypothetical protein F5X97DRAFT_253134 [Nemania serpens]|nr:hypothetical protein F5X97DRAFT_253134 [Nemania serpens]